MTNLIKDMTSKLNILDKILHDKAIEVAKRKTQLPLAKLKSQLSKCPATRNFIGALQQKTSQQRPAIIAEVKKASPSKGVIQENFDPVQTAINYEKQGATCISILTDEKYFQGHDCYLQAIKKNVSLPLLRKDFMIDEYQIYESRLLGADCVLLIVAALNDQQLQDYSTLANELGMAVLVESHDASELNRALQLTTPLIGINNRDLKSFKTHLSTTLNLLATIPSEKIVITESGISSKQDIMMMMEHGVYGFLIGESLMRGKVLLS